MIKRIYNLILLVLFLSIILGIVFNTVLEIGSGIQKSPYARFIVKGGSTIYDFLTNQGINIVKTIIYLVSGFVCISFILLFISVIESVIYKKSKHWLKVCVFLLLAVISLLLLVNMLRDYNKIYMGASYFYLYYLSIIFLLLVLLGMDFRTFVGMKVFNHKENLFNFKRFISDFFISSFIGIIALFITEYMFLLVRHNLTITDVIFSFFAVVSVSFFTSLFYFIAFAIVFYLLYVVFKLCNIELFTLISAFFVAIFTIILIYFWGFEYIRSKTPIFNFVPPLSLVILLYSFSVYPIAYILSNVITTIPYNNILPSLLISVPLGWIIHLPLQILFVIIPPIRKYVYKIIIVISIMICVFFVYRIVYSLYNEKYLSHAYVVTYIASRYLVIIVIFGTFLLFQLLKISNVLNRLVSYKMFFIYLAMAIVGYTLLGLRENVRFLLVRKSEIIGSAIKTLREVTDFDRDEFSYFFYGGDRSELNTRDNPYFKNYFKVNTEEGIVGKDELFEPAGKVCTGNRQENLDKTNLIIILLDGLRKDMVGVYGNKENLTPNLDNFAKDSIVFNNAYTNSTLSVVLFNFFYSGHYANRNLMTKVSFTNIFDFFCKYERFDNFIIPHLFDRTWLCPNKKVYSIDNKSTEKLQKQYNKYFRYSAVQFKSGIEFLDSIGKNGKFFLHIITLDTHFPFEEFWDGGGFFGYDMKGIYKNHITYQDNNFGMFIEKLKERNLYDNSIIVVFADHGSELKEHGRVFHGYHLYSETTNIPFVIRIPGIKPKLIDTAFSTVDFLPTLLNLLGICPKDERFDGQDFTPLILDNIPLSPSNNNLTFKNDLIFMMDGLEDRYGLIYKNRYKLLYNRTENVFELYDMLNDPKEIRNIVDEEENIFKKLKYIMFDFLYKGFHIYGDVSIFKRVPAQ